MDPIAARDLFPLTRRFIFMNHAGVSPMSDRSRAALASLIEEQATKPHLSGTGQEMADRLRCAIGNLVGAEPDTIGITRGTAHGTSLLAQGLDWREGDNVVGALREHPATIFPWMALRDRGVELRLAALDHGRITPESVLSLVDDRTRVVALSHVQFWNGYRIDLERIGTELDKRAVVFAVDGIQSVGALKLDLSSMPVDYLSAGACAWQLGPQGIGFCYCRPELVSRLRPVLVGCGSVQNPTEYFDPAFELCDSARRFEESRPSLLDMAAHLAPGAPLAPASPEVRPRRALVTLP